MNHLNRQWLDARRLQTGREIQPQMAVIYPTNRCNQGCSGCAYRSEHAGHADQMSGEQLLNVLEQITDLGVISLLVSGGGEPLLNPNCPEFLTAAAHRGLECGVFTNGTPIDEALAECLAGTAVFVRLSIDAATAETYARVRGTARAGFERALASVRMLLEARAKRGAQSRLQVGLKFLVRPDNLQEIPAFVQLAKTLQVDEVHFKPLRNSPDAPDRRQLSEAQRLLDDARQRFSDLAIRGSLPPETTWTMPCWISPLRLMIGAEGNVYLCPNFTHRKATHACGNVFRERLRDIWFGAAHRRALTGILDDECRAYDCRFQRLNQQLHELLREPDGGTAFL